jgi:hypothetical protein
VCIAFDAKAKAQDAHRGTGERLDADLGRAIFRRPCRRNHHGSPGPAGRFGGCPQPRPWPACRPPPWEHCAEGDQPLFHQVYVLSILLVPVLTMRVIKPD